MVSESNPLQTSGIKRVCLVTEELPNFGASGGIGAAFEELAFLLSRNDHEVTILFCDPRQDGSAPSEEGMNFFRNEGITVVSLDVKEFTNVRYDLRASSYAIWRTLLELDGDFDVVHFHDYRGLGFYSCEGKRQGIGLRNTELVVQLHGPTRWTMEANRQFFSEESQVIADYLERRTVELADRCVSPSSYLAEWVGARWDLAEGRKIEVIPNLCGLLEQRLRQIRKKASNRSSGTVENLVIFGRHEDRKGITVAIAALSALNELLTEKQITVHFVGQQGTIEGQPSALFLIKAAASWTFDYTFNFGLTRFTAGEYISTLENSLVIVPAPVENSPYAVLEPLILGVPVLSSNDGGGSELIAPESRAEFCCRMEGPLLADAVTRLLELDSPVCKPCHTASEVEKQWLDFHDELEPDPRILQRHETEMPFVTVGITHYERPQKLGDAVISMLKQDYENLEIIVIDDGTKSPESVKALEELAVLLERSNVKLLREPNRYLGAARNKILEHASGEYIVFLDDDDIALPNLVSTLVRSAVRTDASVTSCMSHYMQEDSRMQVLSGYAAETRVDYFPSGGPLSLSLEQNVFGTATSLIRMKDLKEIGGYSELRGVGNEDFELYIRLAQEGKPFAVCPLPLFLYEVGRPSMLSATSLDKGFKRCFDAVEFAQNSSAWADYCSLNVGRDLVPRAQNRLHWLNSFQEDADDRNRLCDPATDTRDYVNIAATIAEKSGIPRLAIAFRQAFDAANHLRRMPSEAVEAGNNHPILRSTRFAVENRTALPELSRELRRVRHLMAMGDCDRALTELSSYLGTTYSTDDTMLVVIQELADLTASDANRHSVSMVVEALRDKPHRGAPEQMLLSLLRVAHRHELSALRTEIAEHLIDFDRKDYTDRYPDIDEGYTLGNLEPFNHFITYGVREGRNGFKTVARALESLREVSGVNYRLEDFQEMATLEVKTLEAKTLEETPPEEKKLDKASPEETSSVRAHHNQDFTTPESSTSL